MIGLMAMLVPPMRRECNQGGDKFAANCQTIFGDPALSRTW
ncbi:hypothetical protein ABIA65_004881 [Mycolicibacterium sp. 624]